MSAVISNRSGRAGDLRRGLDERSLRLGVRIWVHLPARVRGQRPFRAYGAWLHSLVSRLANREMYLGTVFLRNRPALELLRRLVSNRERGGQLDIAVLGCSIGAEVYSILWTLRSSRPDLVMTLRGVDIEPEAVRVAESGVYSDAGSEMVKASIFEGLTEAERQGMFDWDGDQGVIKPWLREGVTWQVGDALDPDLITSLGPQDVVVANNFLCHMGPQAAESCLRQLAQLVSPGGYLLVAGVDLGVRTKVALDLDWTPISELRAEIHDGDHLVREDWPLHWWGLEPLDRRHPNWETRYTAVFRTKGPE